MTVTDVPAEGDCLYALGAEGATILRYEGEAVELAVPEELGGQPVVAIGGFSTLLDGAYATAGAFAGNTALENIVLPEGITMVADCSFYGCASLEAVVAYGEPLSVEGEAALLPEGATLHVLPERGWEDALDEDGTFHGAAALVHPRPLPETLLVSEFAGVETTLDIAAIGGWTLSGVPEWLELAATEGTGSAQIAAVYAANEAMEMREALITVTLDCGFLFETMLTQAGTPANCDFTLNGETIQVKVGTEVTTTAADKEGHTFAQWNATGVTLANPTAATQSFIMPANAVTLTAEYTVNRYTLTVDGVATEKEYGTAIEVTAEERMYYEFTGWTAEGIAFEHPEELSQSFVMPANDVMLATNYTTEYAEQACVLEVGWNLVTMTGTLVDKSVEQLLSYRSFTWDAKTKGYVKASAARMTAGAPLWVLCRKPTELVLYGKPVTEWSLSLQPGWNCIGAVQNLPKAKIPANATVWEWTQNGYVHVTEGLKAGKAYWILVLN